MKTGFIFIMIKIQNSKEIKNKPTKTGTMGTVAINAIAIKRICHDCHLNLAKKDLMLIT